MSLLWVQSRSQGISSNHEEDDYQGEVRRTIVSDMCSTMDLSPVSSEDDSRKLSQELSSSTFGPKIRQMTEASLQYPKGRKRIKAFESSVDGSGSTLYAHMGIHAEDISVKVRNGPLGEGRSLEAEDASLFPELTYGGRAVDSGASKGRHVAAAVFSSAPTDWSSVPQETLKALAMKYGLKARSSKRVMVEQLELISSKLTAQARVVSQLSSHAAVQPNTSHDSTGKPLSKYESTDTGIRMALDTPTLAPVYESIAMFQDLSLTDVLADLERICPTISAADLRHHLVHSGVFFSNRG